MKVEISALFGMDYSGDMVREVLVQTLSRADNQ
jgi:hypothetical protein